MTQMAWTVWEPLGTVKSRMPVTVSSGADNSSQGRALPAFVRVPVDDVAHDYVGHGVDDFGHDGEHHQKAPPQSPVSLRTSV